MSRVTPRPPLSPTAETDLRDLARSMMALVGQIELTVGTCEERNAAENTPSRAEIVRHYLRARRRREDIFPADLFGEPAWDILLDLYLSELDHRPVSISAACVASAVPATTALRWLGKMTEDGLIIRTGDEHDSRRTFVSLTPKARDAVNRWVQYLETLAHPPPRLKIVG